MDHYSTAEAATNGAMVALAELNVTPDKFLKVAKNVDRLYSDPNRGAVMRKAAGIIADFLDKVPETRGRFASNLMRQMAKSADWHEQYDEYLRDAYTPIMEKKAAGKGKGPNAAWLTILDVVRDIPGSFFTVGAGLGGLGGALAHYAGKQVDEDHIDIEKQRAVQNEYLRLANEIDRKITARALRTQ